MLRIFAKRLNELHEVKRDERGFTLIELLVVVIIIGILAAIAIPVYLNQRADAQDQAVRAQLRAAATAQQSRATDLGNYATDATGLTDYGYRASPDVAVQFDPAPSAAEGGYCMFADFGTSNRFFQISEASTTATAGNCT